MSAVGEHRFADLVRRVMGLRESSALELIPDVLPSFPVVDPADPLMVAGRRERQASGFHKVAATAAQFNHVGLFNPSGSGVIVVASCNWNGLTSGAQAGIVQESAVAATLINVVGTKGWHDARLLLTTSPVASIRHAPTGAASLGASSLVTSINSADGNGRLQEPVILVPGTVLLVDSLVVNEILRVEFQWTERGASPDDLRSPAA